VPWTTQIARRRLGPEIMDQPHLEEARHHHALHDLERVNRLSLSAAILWTPIRGLAQRQAGAPLRILDVASGGGDVTIALWRKARKAGLPVEVHGCDKSAVAVDYARRLAECRGAGIRFFVRDVVRDGLPEGYDVIVSSLFFHHLTDAGARDMLAYMTEMARCMVIVNDLLRLAPALVLAYLACHGPLRSQVARHDALQSVAAAFTMDEIRAAAASANLRDVVTTRHWPFRFRLVWRQDDR
jgi:SAM-dependent methyltransferase